MRLIRLLLVNAAIALVPATAAAAPAITEFGGFAADREPTGIVADPDGNAWVTSSPARAASRA